MRPRPGPGVRTMPEIIKRDRMSQIHTKNYQKYMNTRRIQTYTQIQSKHTRKETWNLPPQKSVKTMKIAIYKYTNTLDSGHKYVH